MIHREAVQILDEIHKNKGFRPNDGERKFLEDLSFYASFENIKISEKQSRMLEQIYSKSQGENK